LKNNKLLAFEDIDIFFIVIYEIQESYFFTFNSQLQDCLNIENIALLE